MKLLLPDASLRSPTAVPNKSDMRDENVLSAGVLQSGANGTLSMFTVPRGQPIPRLAGAAITAPTSAHQTTYTELTTNLTQAGQTGSGIGDISVRAIGITIENAYYSASTVGTNSGLNTYGAGAQEVAEILAKCFFQFLVAGKLQVQGPAFLFPAHGSVFGGVSVSTTANATSAVVAGQNNGWPGAGRRLKLPILVARTDVLEGKLGVAGGASLTFSVTTGIGQPTLVWANLQAAVKGDAR